MRSGAWTPGSRPGYFTRSIVAPAALSVVLTVAAPTPGAGRQRGAHTQRSPKQAECAAPEGGLARLPGLSPSRTPRPSPPGSQHQWACGGGVGNQKLPPPIGCHGQGRVSEAPPSGQGGGADKGSGTALPARRGGWGTLTPRPVVGAGGSPPILMCLHRPGFTPVPCGEGSTLPHRNLERHSEGRTWHSA